MLPGHSFSLARARSLSLSIYPSLPLSHCVCVFQRLMTHTHCFWEVDDTHTHTHTHTYTHTNTNTHTHTHTKVMERVVNFQSEFANVICKIVVDQVNIVFRFFQSASILFFSQSASFCVNILIEKKYYYEKIMYRIYFFSERLNSFLFTERLMNILLEKNKYYYEKIMYRIFFFQSASFLFFSQSASFLLGKKISLWKNDIWLLFCRAPHFCSFHRWCGAAYWIQATSFSYYYHKYYYKKILYRMLFLLLWIGGVGLPTELKLHLSQIIITHIIIKNIM